MVRALREFDCGYTIREAFYIFFSNSIYHEIPVVRVFLPSYIRPYHSGKTRSYAAYSRRERERYNDIYFEKIYETTFDNVCMCMYVCMYVLLQPWKTLRWEL